MEIWDAYDVGFNRLDKELVRGESIPQGLYHGVAVVFVQHTDGSLLMMHRDPSKPHFPNMWELGASGSITKGESFLQGAFRELVEETGLVSDNMHYLGKACYPHVKTLYKVYGTIVNGNKEDIRLQEFETDDYSWISKDEASDLLNNESCIIMFPELMKKWLELFGTSINGKKHIG